MVTRPTGDGLASLERALDVKSNKWDLTDMSKADAWMLNTQSVLQADEAAWYAVNHGPPTPEMVLARSPSSMPKTRAVKIAESLLTEYTAASARAYTLLLPRIDFTKKP